MGKEGNCKSGQEGFKIGAKKNKQKKQKNEARAILNRGKKISNQSRN